MNVCNPLLLLKNVELQTLPFTSYFLFFLFLFLSISLFYHNRGEAFFYSQNIVTISQLQEGIVLQFPNATLLLPPKFDEQIAYVCIFVLKIEMYYLFLFPLSSPFLLPFLSPTLSFNRTTKKQQETILFDIHVFLSIF